MNSVETQTSEISHGSDPHQLPMMAKTARVYDNSQRQAKAVRNQDLILETLAQLLIANDGKEIPFDLISEKSGLSVRTIFRSFNDKESLYRAFEDRVISILAVGREAIHDMPLVDLAKYLFLLFERERLWIEAHMLSSNVTSPREKFRQTCFLMISERIRAEYPGDESAERDRKIALIAMLFNANLWSDLNRHFGYGGEEMAGPLGWAVDHLLADLKKSDF